MPYTNDAGAATVSNSWFFCLESFDLQVLN